MLSVAGNEQAIYVELNANMGNYTRKWSLSRAWKTWSLATLSWASWAIEEIIQVWVTIFCMCVCGGVLGGGHVSYTLRLCSMCFLPLGHFHVPGWTSTRPEGVSRLLVHTLALCRVLTPSPGPSLPRFVALYSLHSYARGPSLISILTYTLQYDVPRVRLWLMDGHDIVCWIPAQLRPPSKHGDHSLQPHLAWL